LESYSILLGENTQNKNLYFSVAKLIKMITFLGYLPVFLDENVRIMRRYCSFNNIKYVKKACQICWKAN
jgi:hypothetical protein